MELNASIGSKVRTARQAKRLTTIQLAEMVGISQAQISRLEMGKQGFRTSTLTRIANALEYPPSYFLNGEAISDVDLAMVNAEFKTFVETAASAFIRGEQATLKVPVRV